MRDINEVLEELRKSKERVHVFYAYDHVISAPGAAGLIGRSTGEEPAYLLLSTKRSLGGDALSAKTIARIMSTHPPYKTLWEDGTSRFPVFEIDSKVRGTYRHHVLTDGERVANFQTLPEAENFVDFSLGQMGRASGRRETRLFLNAKLIFEGVPLAGSSNPKQRYNVWFRKGEIDKIMRVEGGAAK
jgi:hypothetical protein